MKLLTIIISIFLFLQTISCQIINYINIEKKDYCESLNNEKRWIEKQLIYHANYYEYYQETFKDLNILRKEVSQMTYRLCTNQNYEL